MGAIGIYGDTCFNLKSVLKTSGFNPIQYGLFLKHYSMGGGALWPPL